MRASLSQAYDIERQARATAREYGAEYLSWSITVDQGTCTFLVNVVDGGETRELYFRG